MKKLPIFFLLFIITLPASAQNLYLDTAVSVEYTIAGFQTNGLETMFYKEQRLTNSISLRTEAGFNSSFFSNNSYSRIGYQPSVGFVSRLEIAAEPRWYYNLKKRNRKNKNTANNSASFISLRAIFTPNWLHISNIDTEFNSYNEIALIPTFGLRRTWWNHFDFELGLAWGMDMLLLKMIAFLRQHSDHTSG